MRPCWVVLWSSCGHLKPSCGCVGLSCGHLGAVLCRLGDRLAAVLGCLVVVLGPSCGSSCGRVGLSCGRLGAVISRLGPCWDRLRVLNFAKKTKFRCISTTVCRISIQLLTSVSLQYLRFFDVFISSLCIVLPQDSSATGQPWHSDKLVTIE